MNWDIEYFQKRCNEGITTGSPKPDYKITETLSCNPLCLSDNYLSSRIEKCDNQMKNVFGKNIKGETFTKRAFYNPARYMFGKHKRHDTKKGGHKVKNYTMKLGRK